ncbi:MAG: hypothetical protein ACKO16_08480 [Gemmataceae bacterium]
MLQKIIALIIFVSLIAGCGGPWSWSGSGIVNPGKIESFILKPPVRNEEQRYKLYFKSSDKADVYVVAEKDAKQAIISLNEDGKVDCPTLAQPSHQANEMVLGVLQVAPTENFAVLVVNKGTQSISLVITAQER